MTPVCDQNSVSTLMGWQWSKGISGENSNLIHSVSYMQHRFKA